jgi:hypothetical protein
MHWPRGPQGGGFWQRPAVRGMLGSGALQDRKIGDTVQLNPGEVLIEEGTRAPWRGCCWGARPASRATARRWRRSGRLSWSARCPSSPRHGHGGDPDESAGDLPARLCVAHGERGSVARRIINARRAALRQPQRSEGPADGPIRTSILGPQPALTVTDATGLARPSPGPHICGDDERCGNDERPRQTTLGGGQDSRGTLAEHRTGRLRRWRQGWMVS